MAVPPLRVLLAVTSEDDEKRLGKDIESLRDQFQPSLDLSYGTVWDHEHLNNRGDARISDLSPWSIRAHTYKAQAGLVLLDQSFPHWREVNFLIGGQPLWESVGLVRPRGDHYDLATEDIAIALSSQALAGYISIESDANRRRKGLEVMIRNALKNRQDSGVQIGAFDEKDYTLADPVEHNAPPQDLLDSAIAQVLTVRQDAVRKEYGSARRSLTEALSALELLKTSKGLNTALIADTLREAIRYTPDQTAILPGKEVVELHRNLSREPREVLSELQATTLLQYGLPMEGGLLDILTRGAFIRSEYNAQEARYALGNATKILDLLETLCNQHPEASWSRDAMQSVHVNRVTIARRNPVLYTGDSREGQLDFSNANRLAEHALTLPLDDIKTRRVQYEQGIIAAFEAEDLAMHGFSDDAAQAALRGLAYLNFDVETVKAVNPSWAAYLAKGEGLAHTAALVANPLQTSKDRARAKTHFEAALRSFDLVGKIAASEPTAQRHLPDLYGNLGTLYGYAALAELGTSEERAQFRDHAVRYTSMFADLHDSPPYDRFAQKALIAFGEKE